MVSRSRRIPGVDLFKPIPWSVFTKPCHRACALPRFKHHGVQAVQVYVSAPMVSAAPRHRAVREDVQRFVHALPSHVLRSTPFALPNRSLMREGTGGTEDRQVNSVLACVAMHDNQGIRHFFSQVHTRTTAHVRREFNECSISSRRNPPHQLILCGMNGRGERRRGVWHGIQQRRRGFKGDVSCR